MNVSPLEDTRGAVELRGILRQRLLQKLADILPEDSIQFQSNVASVDLTDTSSIALIQDTSIESCALDSTGRPVLKLDDGREIRCRVLVGAEGVGSKTASALGLPSPVYQGICAIRLQSAAKSLFQKHF